MPQGWDGWDDTRHINFSQRCYLVINVTQFRNSHHAYMQVGVILFTSSFLSWRRGRPGIGQGFELKAFLRIKYPTPGTLWLVKRKLILYTPLPTCNLNVVKVIMSFQSARMPVSFRISFLSSVQICLHIFLGHAGNVFHL